MPDAAASALLPSPVPLLRALDRTHPDRAARRGELVAVRRGVYAPAATWRALAPWDRYLARVHAVALTRRGCVFSHESAAVLLGLPVFGDSREVHVLAEPAATGGDRSDVRIHTTRDRREIIDVDGIALTSASECAVDIARSRCELQALAVADAALRRDGGSSAEALVARNEGRASSRGRRLARWALHRAAPAPESTLESLSRGCIELLGYEEPLVQVPIGRDRPDFWWIDGLIGEADGDIKYDGRFGDATELLRQRRARDARLLANGARRISHWGWDDVVEFDRLDGILRSMGVRRVGVADLARLTRSRAALRTGATHSQIPRDSSFTPRPWGEPTVSA